MIVSAGRPNRMWGVTDKPSENLYIPMIASIDDIIDETPDTKTYRLSFDDKEYAKSFSWEPGQFVELSVFGGGEAPIGFSSNPLEKSYFDLTIVERGVVTQAMHRLGKGDKVGIRGPLGNCWPMEAVKGMDLIIISGGCGLAPLKPAIHQVLANRKDYGNFWLLYGARTPADRNFKHELEAWCNCDDFNVLQTVDVADEDWKDNVGVVTTLFDKIHIDIDRTVAFTCGPPVMIKFATAELMGKGMPDDRIVTSLERYMKCGVGKCGHCCIDHAYICTEGPIFTYRELKGIHEFSL